VKPGTPLRLRSAFRWSEICEPLPEGLAGYLSDLPAHANCLPVDFGKEMGGTYQIPEVLLEVDAGEVVDLAQDGLDRRDVLGRPDESGTRVAVLTGRF